jgi:hypothetical protein
MAGSVAITLRVMQFGCPSAGVRSSKEKGELALAIPFPGESDCCNKNAKRATTRALHHAERDGH